MTDLAELQYKYLQRVWVTPDLSYPYTAKIIYSGSYLGVEIQWPQKYLSILGSDDHIDSLTRRNHIDRVNSTGILTAIRRALCHAMGDSGPDLTSGTVFSYTPRDSKVFRFIYTDPEPELIEFLVQRLAWGYERLELSQRYKDLDNGTDTEPGHDEDQGVTI